MSVHEQYPHIEHLAECRGPKWHTEVSVIAKQILLDSVLAWLLNTCLGMDETFGCFLWHSYFI